MSKLQVLQQLVNTKLDGEKTKKRLGALIRKEFDETKEPEKAIELMAIGWKYQIPQLDEMITDFDVEFNF